MKKANNNISTSNRNYMPEVKPVSWKSIGISLLLSVFIIFIINTLKSAAKEPVDDSTEIYGLQTSIFVEVPSCNELSETSESEISTEPSKSEEQSETSETLEEPIESIPEEVHQEEFFESGETQITNEPVVVSTEVQQQDLPFSEQEIGWIVQLVQHEVGNDPTCFPGYDFDFIQQCMTRVIINRVGRKGFADNVYDVIMQPKQFLDISELEGISPTDETTLRNVMKVLNDEDGISKDLLVEMSYKPGTTPEDALEITQSQITLEVSTYYSALTVEGRYLLFGEIIS